MRDLINCISFVQINRPGDRAHVFEQYGLKSQKYGKISDVSRFKISAAVFWKIIAQLRYLTSFCKLEHIDELESCLLECLDVLLQVIFFVIVKNAEQILESF